MGRFSAPRSESEQAAGDDDLNVGDVEDARSQGPDADDGEVDDVAGARQPIHQVARAACDQQAQAHKEGPRQTMTQRNHANPQEEQGDADDEEALAHPLGQRAAQPQKSPGIFGVHQAKDADDDVDAWLSLEMGDGEGLGDLIAGHTGNEEGEKGKRAHGRRTAPAGGPFPGPSAPNASHHPR